MPVAGWVINETSEFKLTTLKYKLQHPDNLTFKNFNHKSLADESIVKAFVLFSFKPLQPAIASPSLLYYLYSNF